MALSSQGNAILALVRGTFADAKASACVDDFDLTDHLDAWEGSLREPSAREYYSDEEIEHALAVITRLANVRERIDLTT